MFFASFAPLLFFAVVSTFTPGAATTLATASGAQFGFLRSIPVLAGSAAGLALVTAASGAGLASLLMAVPSLRTVMKIAGTTYLLWLGWKIARAGPPRLDRDLRKPSPFRTGLVLLLFNPKGWTMGLGAAASFAFLADTPLQLALLLGSTFGLISALSLVLWCLAGLVLARHLRTDRQWRLLNLALGLLLALTVLPMWL